MKFLESNIMSTSSNDEEGAKLFSLNSTRFKLCFLLMLGVFFVSSMRVSLSMAIVCMVHRKSGTNLTFSAEFQLAELSMRAYDETLNWSSNQITLILSATFYGGLIAMFWSGYLSDRFTPKIVIVCAVLDCIVVSGFTPFLAYKNFYALFFARVAMGLGEDFLGPAQSSFITRWYAPSEMTRIGALTCAGKALAGTLSLPLASIFCNIHTQSSWHLTFYTLTMFGSAWVLTWGLYSSDTPALHRHITKEERNYIETELQELTTINHEPKSTKLYEGTVPWKSIITSWPIIVNIICQFTFNFSEAILSAFLPMYIDEVLQVSLDTNGFLGMLFFLSQLICQIICATLTDCFMMKDFISMTTSCKIFQCFQNFGVGIVFVSLAFFVKKGAVALAAILFILCGISFSAGISGFETSQASLAPQFVGILSSFLRAVASLGALSSINMVGWIDKSGAEHEWTIVWLIAAALNFVAGTIFLFAGSGDTQPWAQTPSSTKKEEIAQKQEAIEKERCETEMP